MLKSMLSDVTVAPQLIRVVALVLLVSASAAACGDRAPARQTEGGSETVLEPAVRLSDASLVIGEADSIPGHLLHRLTAVFRTPDGRIVVGNGGSNEIRVFDSAGSLLAEMGGPGEGPEEFSFLQAVFAFPGDSLIAWDPLNRRMSVWSSGGEFGRTIPVRVAADAPRIEARLEDGRYLAALPRRARASTLDAWETYTDSLDVMILDLERSAREEIGTFPDTRMVVADAGEINGPGRVGVPIPDGPGIALASDGRRIFVGLSDSSRVRVFDSVGDPAGSFGLSVPARPRPREAVEASINAALERVPADRRGAVRGYLAEIPQPSSYPAFDMMLADHQGHLWIRKYPGFADTAAVWTVVTGEGERVAEHVLPVNFRPSQIGNGWILGVWTDDADRELVALFPFDH